MAKGDFFGGRELGDRRNWAALKDKVAKQGLRNGCLMAIAPTGSISLIAGATAGLTLSFQNRTNWKTNGVFVSAVPNLNDETFGSSKAHKIDQRVVRAAAARQKWIDQSQSLNLFVTSDAKAKSIELLCNCVE